MIDFATNESYTELLCLPEALVFDMSLSSRHIYLGRHLLFLKIPFRLYNPIIECNYIIPTFSFFPPVSNTILLSFKPTALFYLSVCVLTCINPMSLVYGTLFVCIFSGLTIGIV